MTAVQPKCEGPQCRALPQFKCEDCSNARFCSETCFRGADHQQKCPQKRGASFDGSGDDDTEKRLLGNPRALLIMAKLQADDLEYTISSMQLPSRTDTALRSAVGDLQEHNPQWAIDAVQQVLLQKAPRRDAGVKSVALDAKAVLSPVQLQQLRNGSGQLLINRADASYWRIASTDANGQVRLEYVPKP